MELLTADEPYTTPNDFPQHTSPFPDTGNLPLSVSNPTAVIHSTGGVNINGQNLPTQKLRPIRGTGKFPSCSEANDLPPLDGSPNNLGLWGEHGEASVYFNSTEQAEAGEMAFNGGGVCGAQCVVMDVSMKVGSGTDEGNGGPKCEEVLLEGDSSSSLDDDNNSSVGNQESASRKRERKTRKILEVFLESLVMKVMDKQEQMHNQLIEMMERKERQRVMREEALKQKEMERMKRDEELRAEETSRSLALISFIQNVIGHEIEIPQQLTTIENSVVKNGGNFPIQNDTKVDPNNRRWPDSEEQALIMLRTALEQKFRLSSKGSSIWDAVSAGMYNLGYNRTAKKCKEKWENINKYFKKSLESRGKKRHENSKTCPYFQELDILYKNGFLNPGDISNLRSNQNEADKGQRNLMTGFPLCIDTS